MGGLEDAGIDAIKTINDGSVTGAIAVLLLILIVWREVFYWPREIAKREAENDRCHAAHDITRSALLEEVRSGGETLVLVREQLRAQAAAVDSLMKAVADSANNRRRGQ